MIFKIDRETFGVNVSKVVEILEVPHITKIPKAPAYIRGVINLRGTVLPVVDTRIKFGLAPVNDTASTCIIVLSIDCGAENTTVGVLVDEVKAVLEINESTLAAVPKIGGKYDSEYLKGFTSQGDDFVMMLNIDKVFASKDIVNLKDHMAATNPIA